MNLQQKQQQSLTQINAAEWMFSRYPLISKRKEAISSATEAVRTNDLAISAIDAQIENGITFKWIKAQLIEVLNFCGAFGAVLNSQVVIIAHHIRSKYYYLTPTELTYFFEQFIGGAYGTLYVGKTINPQVILQAIRLCENALINKRAEIQEEIEEARRKVEKELTSKGLLGVNGWLRYCQRHGITDQPNPMQGFIKDMKKKQFNVK